MLTLQKSSLFLLLQDLDVLLLTLYSESCIDPLERARSGPN